MMASAGKRRRVLFIVENLPSPFDRRIWQEATTLQQAGYTVSIICPTGPGCEKRFEVIDDIAIYRHPLPLEAKARSATRSSTGRRCSGSSGLHGVSGVNAASMRSTRPIRRI